MFLENFLLFIHNNIIAGCHCNDIIVQLTKSEKVWWNAVKIVRILSPSRIIWASAAYSIVRLNLNSTPSQGTHSERSCWRRIASIQWRESVRRVRSCQLLPHALCWTHKYLQLVSCCKLSLFFRIQFFRWLLDFFRNAYNQISAVCIRARSF